MDVYEAVTSRRAVRGFTDRQVPREALERVLSAAAWSPSGSNIQPWRAYLDTSVASVNSALQRARATLAEAPVETKGADS
ncbi:nitroreductase family protein, partial [Streptomyces sp. NPDC005356]|uniref:nitroreductase family protein n=1 Tax=Streptomyces sp. NPDC005356 TaxID=3157167 RepID=UPI0033B91588